MANFLILGGDKRQKVLYDTLLSKGIDTLCLQDKTALDKINSFAGFSHIVLPVPVSRNSVNIFSDNENFCLALDELAERLNHRHTVFGGSYPKKFKASLDEKNITYFDFLQNEDFLLSNAVLTAQGALRLLLENTDKCIAGESALIIGFGRVAIALASVLKAVGLDIYIAARSDEQLKKAARSGYKTMKLSNIRAYIYFFDYIFGSVPAKVITRDAVSFIRDDAVYFELASPPFSAEKEDFTAENKRYVNGAALPGKYLSAASGKLIADCILSFIKKQKE